MRMTDPEIIIISLHVDTWLIWKEAKGVKCLFHIQIVSLV